MLFHMLILLTINMNFNMKQHGMFILYMITAMLFMGLALPSHPRRLGQAGPRSTG